MARFSQGFIGNKAYFAMGARPKSKLGKQGIYGDIKGTQEKFARKHRHPSRETLSMKDY
jgi:hypothetical protein